jgi:hypothetical protein
MRYWNCKETNTLHTDSKATDSALSSYEQQLMKTREQDNTVIHCDSAALKGHLTCLFTTHN